MLAPLLTVGACTALVKVAGAAKVLIIARYFGLEVDEFLVAFVIVMFGAEAISSATNASLVPVLVELHERGDDAGARKLFSTTTLITGAQLAGLAIALVVLSGHLLHLLASGFDAQKSAAARQLLGMMAPVLLLSGISATWRSVVNAHGRFLVPAATPALVPLTTILLVCIRGSQSTQQTLAWSAIAGSAAELAVIAWFIRTCGLPLLPSTWPSIGDPARRVLRQYGPMLGGACVLGGSTVVNHSMAAMLGAGSVSALAYGNKVVSVLLAVGPATVATVALPHFSRLVARDEWSAVAATLARYRRLILFTTIPVTFVLFAASEPLVRILYEHGSFSPRDTAIVAEVQKFYVLQLPFVTLTALLFRLVSSLRANDVLMWAAVLHLFASATLNYMCMQWRGVAGIALAGSIAAALHYCCIALVLRYLINSTDASGRLVLATSTTDVLRRETD
jgi:putative peptidoglycan lipid II flippase